MNDSNQSKTHENAMNKSTEYTTQLFHVIQIKYGSNNEQKIITQTKIISFGTQH